MSDLAAAIVATTHHPLLVLDGTLRVKLANPAFCAAFTVSPEDAEGSPLRALDGDAWDVSGLHERLEAVLHGGPELTDFRLERDGEGADPRVWLVRAHRMGRDGDAVLVTFEASTGQEPSTDAPYRRESWPQDALGSDGVGVLFFEEDSGVLIDANDTFLEMSGYGRDEVESRLFTWRDLTPPEWVDVSEEQMKKLRATGFIGPYEKEYLNKDGSRSWMIFTGRGLGDGTVVEHCFDISEHVRERLAAEKQRELLLAELNHRVKNTLAVVQGMAAQTLARSQTLEDFGEAFQGRLDALARGHDQLVEACWRAADLQDVVAGVVGTFREDVRVRADGPPVQLDTRMVLALTLVLHELETNATKYGALSQEDGRVDISWALDDDGTVRMVWRERNGPAVEPAKRQGFGTRLIKELVAYELDGEVRLDLHPQGLVAEIRFPAPGA